MVSDVRIDTGYDVEPMLMLWEKTSRMYGDFAIQLVRLNNGAGNSIVATYKVAFTISENLLRNAFPHLLTSRGMSLKEKLIGQQLEMTGASTFIWDDEQEQVSSALYSIDMLTPLHRLLGNVEELSRVFDNALVTPECRIVSALHSHHTSHYSASQEAN
ncbi:unnamed protein product [Phytophthora lilii]|uniref:Unnamed protein product n=1 Tax=Phytophthora lilii TaxID=2077276 RepID=A0A9W7CMU8_9STRA|nr:unnamed protein product [Phytophthora lilii]